MKFPICGVYSILRASRISINMSFQQSGASRSNATNWRTPPSREATEATTDPDGQGGFTTYVSKKKQQKNKQRERAAAAPAPASARGGHGGRGGGGFRPRSMKSAARKHAKVDEVKEAMNAIMTERFAGNIDKAEATSRVLSMIMGPSGDGSDVKVEYKSRVLQEVVTFHDPEILGDSRIMKLIRETRAANGYSYMHYPHFQRRKDIDLPPNIDEMVTCIAILMDCGCTPFRRNERGETVPDSFRYATDPTPNDKGVVRRNIYFPGVDQADIDRVFRAITSPSPAIVIDSIKPILNKITPDDERIRKFATRICWAASMALPALVEDTFSRCLQVYHGSKAKGFYNSVHRTIDIIRRVFAAGPQADPDFDEYFEVHAWNPAAMTTQFETLLTHMAMTHDLSTINRGRYSVDAVGAVIGEIGSAEHIEAFISAKIGSSPENVVTCLTHSRFINRTIAQLINDAVPDLPVGTRVFIEFGIEAATGKKLKCSQVLSEFTSEDIGPKSATHVVVGTDDDSFAETKTIDAVEAGDAGEVDEANDMDEPDYDVVDPPYDTEIFMSFKFAPLNGVGSTDLSYDDTSFEFSPAALDDVAYSVTKAHAKEAMTEEVVSAMIAKFSEDVRTDEGIAAFKFMLSKLVDHRTLSGALDRLTTCGDISYLFDAPDAMDKIHAYHSEIAS